MKYVSSCWTKKVNSDGQLEAEFNLKGFGEYFDINAKNTYSFAKKWSEKIQRYQYFLPINENQFERHIVIPSTFYNSGVLRVKFHKVITEHLLNLKDNKIFIELKHLQKIKNPRFIKLYEYLKAKVFVSQINRIVNITIQDLYDLLIVLNNNYHYFSDFKRWVLVPVINEFEKINDIKIEKWEVVKTGRKVTSIRFWVSNFSNQLLTKEDYQEQNFSKTIKCQKCWQGNYKIREVKSGILVQTDQRFFYGWHVVCVKCNKDKIDKGNN